MAVTSYYSVNGILLGEKSTGGSRVDYLSDALGSVTATVNASAAVVNTYRYKPYGTQLAKTGSGSDPAFAWVGQWGYRQTNRQFSDVYVRARHYSSMAGRWTTKDPIGFVDGLNVYHYARLNPIQRTDFLGLFCTREYVAIFMIPPCKERCSTPFSTYRHFQIDISRPAYNFSLYSQDCPKPGDQLLIRLCKADHHVGGADLGEYGSAALTCCCCTGGDINACTQYNPPFFKMPKIYQTCTWDHEMERRQCCFDTCSGALKRQHHQDHYIECVWKRLVSCYGQQNAKRLFPDCIGNGFISRPICAYGTTDSTIGSPSCPELTAG